MRARAAVVSAVFLAFGCGGTVTGPSDVIGVTWRLQSLQRADGSVVTSPAGTFTLRFAEDSRLEVRADCNGCGGTYQLAGGALSVSPLVCTRMACPSPYDAEYVRILDAATSVERTDGRLTVRSPAGVLRFVN